MKFKIRVWVGVLCLFFISCSGLNNAKRGCPANDSNLGAERVMSGEGSKKPSKFKVKDMDKSYSQ